MGKIVIEICLISARGLRGGTGIGSSLFKHQWYAVGWIDSNEKYCTSIDVSRSDNPFWRTKFFTLLDDSSSIDDSIAALNVEVYSREPIFLRKRLHGSATVSLKKFLVKFKEESSSNSGIEEVGSYQLRKSNSSKLRGFVDVSIRISKEREDFGGFTGDIGGIMLSSNSNSNTGQTSMADSSIPYPAMNNTNPQIHGQYQQPYYPTQPPPPRPPPLNTGEGSTSGQSSMADSSKHYPAMNNTNPQIYGQYQQPYYPPQAPLPRPPPLNTGVGSYIPSYIPRSENIVNLASSSSAAGGLGRGNLRPGLAFAAGAVAAADAVMYGGEYLSGFKLPSSLPNPRLNLSIDPPF